LGFWIQVYRLFVHVPEKYFDAESDWLSRKEENRTLKVKGVSFKMV